MGITFSSIFSSLFGGKDVRILILGLDNSGKTTTLMQLQGGQVEQTVPTLGFNLETVQHKNLTLQCWDLGGQAKLRAYWKCYYSNTSAVVYVVDTCDHERIGDAKRELDLIVGERDLEGVPLLVLANKQDMPRALSSAAVSEQMNLTAIRDRQWAIFPTSAITRKGITEAFDWLCDVLNT